MPFGLIELALPPSAVWHSGQRATSSDKILAESNLGVSACK